jgi:endonuclease/exonuclease/phosphatase family metal-dependent hydrolase
MEMATSPYHDELARLEYVFRRGNMDLSKLNRHMLFSNTTMTIRLSKILGVEFVRGAREPRVISIVPATIALLVLFCGLAWGVFVFQPYGDRLWLLGTVALGLVGVVVVKTPGSRLTTEPPLRLERILGRSLWLGKSVLAGALGCWLGIIAWSAISSGGPLPAANANPASIRVLTWNILHGTERGMPWTRYGWPVRKKALKTALAATRPDIFCVQEALEEQLEFLAGVLPGHQRVGVGRDDGRSTGERCAIFFDRKRFLELGGGTFWLEQPIDEPAVHRIWGPKRICTWVRLRDQETGRSLRVYNTHQYLTEPARVEAVRVILAKIDMEDPSDAVLVAGDFNAPPETQDRRLFEAVGFISTAQRAGASTVTPTYQFYGIRLRRLDDILVNRGCRVVNHYVVDAKPDNIFPSDHFGVMADLVLEHRDASILKNP